jgi:hypothetical protein
MLARRRRRCYRGRGRRRAAAKGRQHCVLLLPQLLVLEPQRGQPALPLAYFGRKSRRPRAARGQPLLLACASGGGGVGQLG